MKNHISNSSHVQRPHINHNTHYLSTQGTAHSALSLSPTFCLRDWLLWFFPSLRLACHQRHQPPSASSTHSFPYTYNTQHLFSHCARRHIFTSNIWSCTRTFFNTPSHCPASVSPVSAALLATSNHHHTIGTSPPHLAPHTMPTPRPSQDRQQQQQEINDVLDELDKTLAVSMYHDMYLCLQMG